MRVGNLTKSIIKASPKSDPLTYSDINGHPLQLPDFSRQPYRRAIFIMAKTACDNALGSVRPHTCLNQLNLTEERWREISESIRTESGAFEATGLGLSLKLMNDA